MYTQLTQESSCLYSLVWNLVNINPGFCELSAFVYVTRSGTSRSSTGLVGLPHPVAHSCNGKLQGQNYFLEVALGCSSSGSEKSNQPNSNINRGNHPTSSSPSTTRDNHKVSSGNAPFSEKTFIYPSEAVLVPVFQTTYARSSLKRCINHSIVSSDLLVFLLCLF